MMYCFQEKSFILTININPNISHMMDWFFSLSHCNTGGEGAGANCILGPSEDAGVVFRVTCNYSAAWLGTLAQGRHICSKGRS